MGAILSSSLPVNDGRTLDHRSCVAKFFHPLRPPVSIYQDINNLPTCGYIGGGKGGAMGLQPHLILRVLHSILILYRRSIIFLPVN